MKSNRSKKPASKPSRKITLLVLPVVLSESKVAEAFTEWERRFREEPERFQSEAVTLLKETPESYGAAAAPYFLQILGELCG